MGPPDKPIWPWTCVVNLALALKATKPQPNLTTRFSCMRLLSIILLARIFVNVFLTNFVRGFVGSQHPSPNVKTLSNFEPQI